jgi:hypothetical protein
MNFRLHLLFERVKGTDPDSGENKEKAGHLQNRKMLSAQKDSENDGENRFEIAVNPYSAGSDFMNRIIKKDIAEEK